MAPLAFASTVAALRAADLAGEIDPRALIEFLHFGFVGEEHAIHEGIRKLSPATILEWQDGEMTERRYWTLPEPRSPQLEVANRRRLRFRAGHRGLSWAGCVRWTPLCSRPTPRVSQRVAGSYGMRLRGDRFARWRHSGTDRGGPQRLLFDTGDPEDLAKALSTLIQDAALRTQLRTAAAERARAHFSLAHSVRCIKTV